MIHCDYTNTSYVDPILEMEFIMTFSDLTVLPSGITAWDNISEWNAKLLSSSTTPFTSIFVDYDNFVVGMSGARDGILKGIPNQAFYNYAKLYSIVDTACITGIESYSIDACGNLEKTYFKVLSNSGGTDIGVGVFKDCVKLWDVLFDVLIRTGHAMFWGCNITEVTTTQFPQLGILDLWSFADNPNLYKLNHAGIAQIDNYSFRGTVLTEIYIPGVIFWGFGTALGQTATDEGVFEDISGNVINATFHNSLATNYLGNPDGDIQYLQANNTVTITWV